MSADCWQFAAGVRRIVRLIISGDLSSGSSRYGSSTAYNALQCCGADNADTAGDPLIMSSDFNVYSKTISQPN